MQIPKSEVEEFSNAAPLLQNRPPARGAPAGAGKVASTRDWLAALNPPVSKSRGPLDKRKARGRQSLH
jgi:hypothetical protein